MSPETEQVVNGEDILSNSLISIKQYIPRKRKEVKDHAPTGDKASPQYQLNAAHMQGYLQALADIETFIRVQGV